MFVLYGRDTCNFCRDAIEHIRTNFPNDEIEYIDYTLNEKTKKYLKEDLQAKTVPQIFHSYDKVNIHIGGYQELIDYTYKWYSTATTREYTTAA